MTIVCDCSMVMAVVLEEDVVAGHLELSAFLSSVAERRVLAPAIWPNEIANGLLVAVRRKRVESGRIEAGLNFAFGLDPIVEAPLDKTALLTVLALARRHQLTIYVELALRTRSVLASLDGAMLRAARGEGVRVLGDPD